MDVTRLEPTSQLPAVAARQGKTKHLSLIAIVSLWVPAAASASPRAPAHSGPSIQSTGWIAIVLFVIAYLFVALEEWIGLRKSKPVMLVAAIIWALIGWSVRNDPAQAELMSDAFERMFLEFAELFFFLVVAMTYVGAMTERGVFEALRTRITRAGLGYHSLFWIIGTLGFLLSSVLDNLTAALVVGTIVLAIGKDDQRFVGICLVNLVVAANAGGAWSAFGDITTLMVWQAHRLEFFDFFRLFLPALVNWWVPAMLMMLALPTGAPPLSDQRSPVKFGGWAICALFALTIAITVLGHQILHLPAVFGMLSGLALLQLLGYAIRLHEATPARSDARSDPDGEDGRYSIFDIIARAEWDTLLFFYGVLLSVGGLAALGCLDLLSSSLYTQLGPTAANVILGMSSAIVDNIPIMYAVLKMHPALDSSQWLLVTLTCGVGGSLLSIGSAAGVALMGIARGRYTFSGHLRWSWAIALGFVASVLVHLALNAPHFANVGTR